MITLRFGPAALAHVRFAISPLVEVGRSRRLLDDPAAGALHLPWVVEALERTADLDLSLLRALDPTGVYTPDFVSPPPDTPLAELEDELAVVAATPPEQARAEVERSYRRKPPLPAVLEPFVADPAAGLAEVVALLRVYWERALAPHWPRVRALLEGDVLHRARQMADGGAERLFADVDPTVSWADGVLSIDKGSVEQDVDLARPRPALRPQRVRLARRRARDRPALAADARLSRARGGDAVGDRPPGGARGARRAARQGAGGRAHGPRPSALDDRPGARARRLGRRASPSTSASCARPGSSTATASGARCSTCARRARRRAGRRRPQPGRTTPSISSRATLRCRPPV